METGQHYKAAGNLNVHNNKDMTTDGKKYYPNWLYIILGALLAFQFVQFIMIGFLYLYIHSVEGRIEIDIRENGKEIIRFLERRP